VAFLLARLAFTVAFSASFKDTLRKEELEKLKR